jgi:hypothetical protein
MESLEPTFDHKHVGLKSLSLLGKIQRGAHVTWSPGAFLALTDFCSKISQSIISTVRRLPHSFL